MDWLRIQNAGEMDPNALFLLGASSKRGDNSKIGFFGSGAKYALAVLLREDVAVRVFSGEREIPITLEGVDFRGQGFRRIVIDGQPTSFTTDMGPTWEPWFALRELLCNALDEGGAAWGEVDEADGDAGIEGTTGTTTFCVALEHPDLVRFIEHMGDYLLPGDSEPLYKAMMPDWPKPIEVRVHEAPENGAHYFYRRGVLVTAHDTTTKGLFRYDFSDAAINESRIASAEWQLSHIVAKAWARCGDDRLVRQVYAAMRAGSDDYEAGLDLNNGEPLNEAWFRVVHTDAGEGGVIIPETLVGYLPPEDTLGTCVIPESLYEALLKAFPGRLNFRTASTEYVEQTSELAEERLAAARARVEDLDVRLTEGYRIVIGNIRASGVLASTNKDTKLIIMSRTHVEEASDEELDSTVAEEFMHSHGYSDGSRAFEDWLIKQLLKARREGRDAVRKVTAIRNII